MKYVLCSIFEKKIKSQHENFGSGGCITTFIEKIWRVTKGALVIEKGQNVGTLYLCKGNAYFYITVASIEVDIKLWRHKLGHMSEKGMQILQ